MKLNKEEEIRLQKAAIAIPVKVAMMSHRIDLLPDLKQDFWVIWLDPDVIKPDMHLTLAFWVAKHRLIDLVRSRKYNESYGNKIKHLSLDSMLDAALSNSELHRHPHRCPWVGSNDKALRDETRRLLASRSTQESDFTLQIIMDELEQLVDKRSWYALYQTLVIGKTQKEVGAELNLTRSMISKIITNAIRTIQRKLEKEILK